VSTVAQKGEPALRPELAPGWLRLLLDELVDIDARSLTRHRIVARPDARRAAVLLALAEDPTHGPDVLLVERSGSLRHHAGQVAFPGGGNDPGDAGPVTAALREAEEETGLDPAGVVPLALLPELFIPPSGFAVTPVLAHWARPTSVHAVDPGETAAVLRAPLGQLADPANRIQVRHPSGVTGPGFLVAGLLVWGFTGGLLSAVLDLGGWARPWDSSRVEDLESAARAARREVEGIVKS
jgi:8-oxo-dGTP pyrophosphatase MutT (NUDIX family)